MKKIQLTQGQIALVNNEDFERLNQFKWCAAKIRNTFYAIRRVPLINGKQTTTTIHHEIIGKPPKGFQTDHKNGIGTDNRRENLHFVTNRQNQQNQIHRNKSSQYPGVCWHKRDKKWRAQICINRIYRFLGHFTNETEAFEAYKQAVENLGETVIGNY